MSAENSESGFTRVRVIRASVDSVSLFEITDWELEIFEKGAPGSTFFNIGSILLSIGISFLTCLITLETDSQRTFVVMTIITVANLLAGIVLLILWHRFGTSTSDVCRRVRARIPSVDAGQSLSTEDIATQNQNSSQ